MLGMIREMLNFMHLYDRYDLPEFFLLFHSIFELFSIFMVMINIVKIELIKATESCLLNIFSVWIFFTNWIILYLSLFLIHILEKSFFSL